MPFRKTKNQNGRPLHPLTVLRERENLSQGELGIICETTAGMIAQVETGNSVLPTRKVTNIKIAYSNFDIGNYLTDAFQYQSDMKKYLLSKPQPKDKLGRDR